MASNKTLNVWVIPNAKIERVVVQKTQLKVWLKGR